MTSISANEVGSVKIPGSEDLRAALHEELDRMINERLAAELQRIDAPPHRIVESVWAGMTLSWYIEIAYPQGSAEEAPEAPA